MTDLSEMDIVIPYKRPPSEDELRYTLRGIMNIPHRKVVIAGDKSYVAKDILHIPKIRRSVQNNRYIDAEQNVVNACTHPEVSENFILMADDIFIMEKMDTIPNWYMDTLMNEYNRRMKISPNKRYVRAYKATHDYLTAKGVTNPVDYNLHTPMVMNKTKRLVISELRHLYLRNNQVLLSRSLYGNIFKLGGEMHKDVKYIGKDDNFEKYPILSTLDTSFHSGEIGRYIRSKLKERSPYEI
jgi:hypothetical protein